MVSCLVLDSMVWAQAAANPRGPSGAIVELARERSLVLVASPYIRAEVRLALHDEGFRRRLGSVFDVDVWLESTLAACAELVDVTGPPVLQEHAKDDPILWLAAAGGASHLVTWEQRLLDLKEHRFTRILTPPAFLRGWRSPAAHEPLAEWKAMRRAGAAREAAGV
jgi:predicted nucleic acid-binding protein